MHHQFFYNKDTKEIRGKKQFSLEGSTIKNFPFRSFYSESENEVVTFYRSSLSIRTPVGSILCGTGAEADQNPDSAEKTLCSNCHKCLRNGSNMEVKLQQIHDKDLGDMFMIFDKMIVARCSDQILFFRLEDESITGEK